MAEPEVQSITINPPEGFTYEQGKPISLPITSLDFKSFIPKDYSEKVYAKKLDSFDSLWKGFDGLQELAGRPYRTPEADAPQEEWDKFMAATRPGKPEEYEFKAMEGLPDEMKAAPEFQGKVKQIFHEAGISKKQAAILQSKWDALMMENFKANKAEADKKRAEMDTQFDSLMKQTFGDQKDQKIEEARKVMIHLMGKDSPYLGLFEKATNEQLVGMTAVLNALKQKYIKEDELPEGENKNNSGNLDELRAKASKLRTEEDELIKKNDVLNPRLSQIRAEIGEVSKQIASLSK